MLPQDGVTCKNDNGPWLLFDLSPITVISWHCVSLTLDRGSGGGGDISSDGYFL